MKWNSFLLVCCFYLLVLPPDLFLLQKLQGHPLRATVVLVINSSQSADTKHEDLWLEFFKMEIYGLVINGTALNLSALTSKRIKQPNKTPLFYFLKPERNILNELLLSLCLFHLVLLIFVILLVRREHCVDYMRHLVYWRNKRLLWLLTYVISLLPEACIISPWIILPSRETWLPLR